LLLFSSETVTLLSTFQRTLGQDIQNNSYLQLCSGVKYGLFVGIT
jgi:hypothetical protein